MFGQQGQPGAKPQAGFTFGGAASGGNPGSGGFTFGGAGASTGTGIKLGTSTTASSTPASKPFSFGSGASSTPGSSFNFTGLSSAGSTTTAAATTAVPTLSLGTTPGQKSGLFGTAPLGSTQQSTGGFSFGAGGGGISTQVNPASSALSTSTTGVSSKPTLFAAPAPAPAPQTTTLSLQQPSTTPSTGLGFKLGTAAAPTPVTGLGSTGTTGGFGLGLAKTTTTSATTASSTTASALPALGSFGTGLASSKPATSLSLTAQTTTKTTASTTGTTTTASSTPQLSYKQLEEQINKWVSDLEDYERTFLDQAAQVNAWDRLLMENGEKITELNDNVESVKAEQKRLDEELDFILAQQQELEVLLKPLEDELRKRTTGPGQLQNADREREFTYGLAKDIDGQLKQMVGDLKSIIEHLNAAGTTQQENHDPIMQVAKILNAHMNSLQWIDQNAALLQRKVDEVSSLSEIRRKEQERNFRLAFD